jgi:hypothetical protein
MIDGAEKQTGEIRAALVDKGYEELRGLCEIFVEHEMLKGRRVAAGHSKSKDLNRTD